MSYHSDNQRLLASDDGEPVHSIAALKRKIELTLAIVGMVVGFGVMVGPAVVHMGESFKRQSEMAQEAYVAQPRGNASRASLMAEARN